MSLSLFQRRSFWIASVAVCLLACGVAWYLWWGQVRLPGPGSPRYEQYVNHFQIGAAALEADVPKVAEDNLTEAINLIPEEPAAWANRGLLYFSTGRLDEAAQDLETAYRLSPEDPGIRKMLGLLEQRLGRFGEAAKHLRVTVKHQPRDIETLYLLAQIVDQEQNEGSDAEHLRLLQQILAVRPDNLLVLSERLKLAIRLKDGTAVAESLERFNKLAPGWLARTRSALTELEVALEKLIGPRVTGTLTTFNNVLRAEPGFTRNAIEVNPTTPVASSALHSFLRLAPVRHAPAEPDMELTFRPDAFQGPAGHWKVAVSTWLTGEGTPTVFLADDHEVRRADGKPMIAGSAAIPASALSASGIVPFDWNNDFRTDLLLAAADGVRFYRQEKSGEFIDVTSETGLAADVLKDDCYGAFAADFDLDGDLDVLLARRSGSPTLLRNNFDKTFTAQKSFSEVDSLRSFAWADLDHDGAPDAAMIDKSGMLHIFANERSGQFIVWPISIPDNLHVLALTIADVNDDGVLDLVALRHDGGLISLSDHEHRASWDVNEVARGDADLALESPAMPGLWAADLDNNGVLDLVASGSKTSSAWMGAIDGKFQKLPAELPPRIVVISDVRDSGHLDLIALGAEGHPELQRNDSRKDYHWQTIRPRAADSEIAKGDNRVNSFGFGGEIELRSGTHVLKQPINAPVAHFGLGARPQADVIRVLWPNGTFQVEFGSPVDQTVIAQQRLKSSCPFLFSWNGTNFVFVTDFMWSTPLGMYINASDKGGFLQTTDWVKIGGDQLVARDDTYEVRVNANLWETHYYDHMSLMAVDHPSETEMFVDERFFFEPADPVFHLMKPPRPVARAWDHKGHDATDEIRSVDGVHLDRTDRGIYQGVTEDHWVEIELGDVAPEGKTAETNRPLWLVARGWVHPTDSSVNFAIEQGHHAKPSGLVLEIPDGNSGWKVGRDRLGFPAGKNKSVLIRLDGIDGPGAPPRFRLRTSMEIYWDAIQFAYGEDDARAVKRVLKPTKADLRFRGILAMSQADRSSPELPDYDDVISQQQYWRDLIGYHTRFGDITELLDHVDDRYAILSAGDEIVFKFDEPAAPPPGWKRDFIWICDGWVKDGDLNTRFGKTVLPLPSHDQKNYDTPPGNLEDDPVYQRHARDWDTYHTRYITPHVYEKGLRNFKAGTVNQPAAIETRKQP